MTDGYRLTVAEAEWVQIAVDDPDGWGRFRYAALADLEGQVVLVGTCGRRLHLLRLGPTDQSLRGTPMWGLDRDTPPRDMVGHALPVNLKRIIRAARRADADEIVFARDLLTAFVAGEPVEGEVYPDVEDRYGQFVAALYAPRVPCPNPTTYDGRWLREALALAGDEPVGAFTVGKYAHLILCPAVESPRWTAMVARRSESMVWPPARRIEEERS